MFILEKAYSMALCVQNKSPHKIILRDNTLEKELSGVNLEIRHLRIFGCPLYIHVHVDKRMKLEPSR
jgi:hypothetical protein